MLSYRECVPIVLGRLWVYFLMDGLHHLIVIFLITVVHAAVLVED
jgi:hypothetical protein